MSEVIIAVDLGGTKIRAARLDNRLNIIERHQMLTLAHEGLAPTLDRIKHIIRQVLPTDGTPITGIGISAPGPLNPLTGVVVAPPNLEGWHNVPLSDILNEAFGVPVYVGNDANVAALAEALLGAARGFRHVIYVTVSTGIGSGIIVDGRLLLGEEGLAAEAGHIIMITEGERVSSLEKEAAGPALARQTRERIAAGEASIIQQWVKGDLSKIDAVMVGQAAQQGDALAVSVVQRGGRMVGLGIVSLLHLFNPEVVVVGGGVANMGDMLFEPLRSAVQMHCIDEAYWRHLKIVPATLGDNVSIIGAASLVATRGGQEDVGEVGAALQELGGA